MNELDRIKMETEVHEFVTKRKPIAVQFENHKSVGLSFMLKNNYKTVKISYYYYGKTIASRTLTREEANSQNLQYVVLNNIMKYVSRLDNYVAYHDVYTELKQKFNYTISISINSNKPFTSIKYIGKNIVRIDIETDECMPVDKFRLILETVLKGHAAILKLFLETNDHSIHSAIDTGVSLIEIGIRTTANKDKMTQFTVAEFSDNTIVIMQTDTKQELPKGTPDYDKIMLKRRYAHEILGKDTKNPF